MKALTLTIDFNSNKFGIRDYIHKLVSRLRSLPICVIAYRDSRKRIGVPKSFLSQIGADPTSWATVYKTRKNKLYISKVKNWDLPKELYTVDSKGNIKISNTVLKEGGFSENEPVKLVLKKLRIDLERV
jgi:hypothetical protein